MTEPLLELAGIGKTFGGVTALSGVDFDLAAGEIHGLVGENGAGKSTLMKIIAGVHGSYEGVMALDGRPVHFRSARDARAAGIGMVHQELSIVPDLSVAENVFLGTQPISALGVVRWRHMASVAKRELAELGLDVDPGVRAGSLPLGVQQLIELGRVLFSGARIVILDEPTSALSPPEVLRLFAVLRRLRGEGRTFVFISHFLDDILDISDRITVFRNARRIWSGRADETDKNRLIDQMIGRGHQDLAEGLSGEVTIKTRVGEGEVVLDAQAIGRRGAFRDVTFQARAGEVLGLYGFMGAGQLELAKALAGKLALDEGTLSMQGKAVALSSTAAAKKAGIALLPESRRAMLFAQEPVYKNISISFLERLSRLFLRVPLERRAAEEEVKRLSIRPYRIDPPVVSLSGGNQQKVALARWLVHLPRVLILSEPTRGMDVGAKSDVIGIVKGLKEHGVAVIVVSSEPETVLALADRILVMRRGRMIHAFEDEPVGKDHLLAAA
ncbi:sugar ABC transporter ATP-binding protein [Marinivivus vitaminiproducens]|uniref:sugar ABC transporter ATP-binding protein n=1 Tax=Marinivivus vitaminiproducens TaxID=3035935 RepID=UPI002799350E|nr:sugar ABC transporter ATP-binding protein [Geminicoccaceae bacterium SCSIO 64248]